MNDRTVLILGAAGRFGQAAAQAFAAAGWRVLAQARRPLQGLPQNTIAVTVPLHATEELARVASGATVLVYAVNPPYTAWRAQALPLVRQGMDVAQRLGATFMLPGNVYNFGQGMPALLNEAAPERPTTVKGRIRCEMEALMQARAADGLRCIVIRAGDFFGGGSGSWFDQAIVKSLAQGKLVYPGPLDVPHAWAYLPDLAHAFVAVAEHADGAPFQRYHFAGHTLNGEQLLKSTEAAAQALGLNPARGFKRGRLPWGLIRIGGLLVPSWRELAEMAYLWQVPHALDGSALAQRFGAPVHTPLDAALRSSLIALGFGTSKVPTTTTA